MKEENLRKGIEKAGKCVIFCGWDDVPHLCDEVKAEFLKSIPPEERDARTKGIPQGIRAPVEKPDGQSD